MRDLTGDFYSPHAGCSQLSFAYLLFLIFTLGLLNFFLCVCELTAILLPLEGLKV